MPRLLNFKWREHMNMMKEFKQFLAMESMIDCTLACAGQSIKAHKVILSACSPVLRSLFLESPCKHPIVFMLDTKYTELKAIIEFIYCGEINVTEDQFFAVVKVARNLRVKGLEEVEFEGNVPADESEILCGDEFEYELSDCRLDNSNWALTPIRSELGENDDGIYVPEIKQEVLSDDCVSRSSASPIPLQSSITYPVFDSLLERELEQNLDECFTQKDSFGNSTTNLPQLNRLPEDHIRTTDQSYQSAVQSFPELEKNSHDSPSILFPAVSEHPSDVFVFDCQEPGPSIATSCEKLREKMKEKGIPNTELENNPESFLQYGKTAVNKNDSNSSIAQEKTENSGNTECPVLPITPDSAIVADESLIVCNENEPENTMIPDPKCLGRNALDLRKTIPDASLQSVNTTQNNLRTRKEKSVQKQASSEDCVDHSANEVMFDVTKPVQLSQDSLIIMKNGQKSVLQHDSKGGQVCSYPVKEQEKSRRRRRGRPRKASLESVGIRTQRDQNKMAADRGYRSEEENDAPLVRRSSRKRKKLANVLQVDDPCIPRNEKTNPSSDATSVPALQLNVPSNNMSVCQKVSELQNRLQSQCPIFFTDIAATTVSTINAPTAHSVSELQNTVSVPSSVSQIQNNSSNQDECVSESNKLRVQLTDTGVRVTRTCPMPVSNSKPNLSAVHLAQPVSQQSIYRPNSMPLAAPPTLQNVLIVGQTNPQHNQAWTATSSNNVTKQQSVPGMAMNATESNQQSSSVEVSSKSGRCIIWQGMIEFCDPISTSTNMQRLPCRFSSVLINGNPVVKTDRWPRVLRMSLLPREYTLVANISDDVLTSSRILLHFHQEFEAFTKLVQFMDSGWVATINLPYNCGIRIILVIYVNKSKMCVGFIPNDQDEFVHKLNQRCGKYRNELPNQGVS